MTRKEFEERTGITDFTDDYYENIIEEGYYFTMMDKDAYCAAVAPLVGSPLLKEWVNNLKTFCKSCDVYNRQQQEDVELMLDVADCLRGTGDEIPANTLEERAIKRIGKKGLILHKIAKGLEQLTDEEKEYVKKHLN